MMLLATASAAAAQLSLSGNYGNPSGCAYLKTGDLDGDDLRYLTSESLSTYASGCDFVLVHADRSGNQLTQGICHHEGDELLTAETHIITPPDPSGGVRIYTGAGELWAELEPCP